MLDKISQKPTALFDISFNSRGNGTFCSLFLAIRDAKKTRKQIPRPETFTFH
ncbi:hypothetical protein FC25_GL000837 [Ligilactobacillus ruminis DSM 20403 = NBRC 102161]|nr:hypothetical protein FC25_GL000837 [Ligilactobacillus ruminis DSM 20403 = NBRC 102161]